MNTPQRSSVDYGKHHGAIRSRNELHQIAVNLLGCLSTPQQPSHKHLD
jgi:hypothetical protein